MPRHYPPERKADALQRLQENSGDILATHAQTGIPQRTLYTWHTELLVTASKAAADLTAFAAKRIPSR